MSEWICDDRIDYEALGEYIRSLTDEEFEEFLNSDTDLLKMFPRE